MVYNRSQEIERRLIDVVDLVRNGEQSTRTLARTLRVSEPTISRCISALRQRGYRIRAVKHGLSWSYELGEEPEPMPVARKDRNELHNGR
jgi:biotin operon repressor